MSARAARLPRGLIGVVHLLPMPGDPCGASGFDAVRDAALRDADALLEGGVRSVVVENFGSAPFVKGTHGARIPPHQAACIALVARQLVERGMCVGVNCLRNDAITALGVAAASGAAFVRVNVHTGVYVADQGLIEGEADQSLRYREALGLPLGIAADVLVKHAAPLAPITPEQATEEALDRGLADAVIVSGTGTGKPVDGDILRRVRAAAGERTVWLGSGFTPALASELAPQVQGAIVGTWLKRDGVLAAPVDPERVKRLQDQTAARFRA